MIFMCLQDKTELDVLSEVSAEEGPSLEMLNSVLTFHVVKKPTPFMQFLLLATLVRDVTHTKNISSVPISTILKF